MQRKNKTLGEFIIENQAAFKYSSGELSKLINAIRLAAKVVNHEVNKAGLVDILGTAGDTNVQGENQQKPGKGKNESGGSSGSPEQQEDNRDRQKKLGAFLGETYPPPGFPPPSAPPECP